MIWLRESFRAETRWILFLVFWLVNPAFSAPEEVPQTKLFALSGVALRSFDAEEKREEKQEEKPAEVRGPVAAEEAPMAAEVSHTYRMSEAAQMQIYEGLNGPILTRMPVEEEPAGALGWVQVNMWDPIFTMEEVRIRKVHITGSIITAIQRKNPLCLLNPLVFAIDW
jgi:hypothetical protein